MRASRQDKRNYNKEWITKVIEENKDMKVLRGRLAEGKQNITKITDKNRQTTTNKEEILATRKIFLRSRRTTVLLTYATKDQRKYQT